MADDEVAAGNEMGVEFGDELLLGFLSDIAHHVPGEDPVRVRLYRNPGLQAMESKAGGSCRGAYQPRPVQPSREVA